VGQILVVSGEESAAVGNLYDLAVGLFQSLHRVRPSHQHRDGGMAVARFQPLHGSGAAIARDAAAGSWGTAAGVWFHRDGPAGRDLGASPAALLAGGTALEQDAAGIDGYFVLAAGRPATGDLAVMTDRGGALHVYQTLVDRCAVVSTSALVLAALRSSELDREAVREFLGTGSVFEERSLFQGVEKLEAATVYRFRRSELVSRSRWFAVEDLFYGAALRWGDVRQLAGALDAALRAVLAVFPRPVFDLTGGYDTRNVLGTALRMGLRPRTLVVGLADHPDVVAANRVARELGLDHRHCVPGRDYPLPAFEDLERAARLSDGECNVLDYAPVAALQAHMAREFDLNVNGSYGELSRGYWWDPILPRLAARSGFDDRRFARRRFAADGWADRMTRGRFGNTLEDHFAGVIARANRRLAGFPNTARADNVYFSLRMQRWGGRIASATLRIRPCASPFFFLGAMAAALSAPPMRRLGGRMAQNLTEHLSPELAALPMAGGYPALPLRLGTLHRFAPLGLELLGRVWGRFLRSTGRRLDTETGTPKPVSAWDVRSLPEIQELLRPQALLTRDLYDESALGPFLAAARSGLPMPGLNLGRILTLELAARSLRAQ
jgi:asparagine synthase (glutamine-hydrolysing)